MFGEEYIWDEDEVTYDNEGDTDRYDFGFDEEKIVSGFKDTQRSSISSQITDTEVELNKLIESIDDIDIQYIYEIKKFILNLPRLKTFDLYNLLLATIFVKKYELNKKDLNIFLKKNFGEPNIYSKVDIIRYISFVQEKMN